MLTVATVCGNILIYGALGWVVVRLLGFKANARVAGLFLAIGVAIGSFGGHAGSEPENLLVLRGLGSILGLGFLAATMFLTKAQISASDA